MNDHESKCDFAFQHEAFDECRYHMTQEMYGKMLANCKMDVMSSQDWDRM